MEIVHSHATSTEFGAMPGIVAAASGGGAVLKVSFGLGKRARLEVRKSSYILTHLPVNHWMHLNEINYIYSL